MADSDPVVFDLDPTIEDVIPKDIEREAEDKKEHGNQLYIVKNYKAALVQYTAAINLCPDKASYYGNRSACFLMLGQYKNGLEDARRAVALDLSFVKGYVRIAKCCLALGDLVGVEQAITRVEELGGVESVSAEVTALQEVKRLQDDSQASYDKKDYRRVIFLMDRCLEYCPASYRIKILKSECLALLGRCQESQEIANDIWRMDNSNADALYVRGMCLYYQDNVDQALKHFQHVLKLAPDHRKAMEFYKRAKLLRQKKEEGNEAFKMGKWQDAYNLYSQALQIDPQNKVVNAKLFFNKATVCSKLDKVKEAVQHCTDALNLDETYLKALLRRAKCHSDLGDFEEAVRDYEKALKMDKSPANKRLLHEAKIALKKSKRKDYYKILGIEKNASEDEIKKAYRKRALVLHPDRHVGASETDRLEQERRFKELGEAYGVLSDPKKKTPYDCGQDFEHGEQEMDPNMMFQSFFGGGGSPFNFHGGSSGGGGYPGGVQFQFG